VALERGTLGKTEHMTPLATGFVYKPRSEVDGFELRPDLLTATEERLGQLRTYHRPPKDLDVELA
jgi:hypothetical protein